MSAAGGRHALQPKTHPTWSRMPRNFGDAGLGIAARVAIKGFTHGESQSEVKSRTEQGAELKYS